VAYDGIHRATYSYNAQGQRVKKARTLSDGRILNYYFQYDKQGQLLSEVYYIDKRLVSYTDFVWLAGRPIAQIKTLYKSNGDLNRVETRYLHTDHLNTPRKATDENGTIVWRWDSDGFGYVQPDRDPDGDGKKQYVRLRFAGQYQDAETGLFYNYFRYYDPYTGRYVTSDPIGLEGGINTYGYVEGNPLKLVDPLGLLGGCPTGMAPGAGGLCSPTKFRDPANSANMAAGLSYDPNTNNPYGPFGPLCGPEGSILATWIPDIVPKACRKHDDCYSKCGSSKLQCDVGLGTASMAYGIAVMLGGEEPYQNAQSSNNCGCRP